MSGTLAGVGILLADATLTAAAGAGERLRPIEKMLRDSLIVYNDGTPRTKHVLLPQASSRGPDLIERVLVIGKHPTLGDLAISDAKDSHHLPGGGPTVTLHLAAGEDHRALIIGEYAVYNDAKCRVRQLATCDEVAQDLIPATIDASYRAAPRHMPRDVLVEHRAHPFLVAPGVEAILGVVEVADQLCIQMHLRHPSQYLAYRRSAPRRLLLRRLARTEFHKGASERLGGLQFTLAPHARER